MDIYEHIEEMKPFIAERNWDGLEAEFAVRCEKLAGKSQARRISGVSLDDYESELREGLSLAVAKARQSKARAIYFEYNLDNDWQGAFFICADYKAEDEGDDDWAAEYDEDLRGPEMARLWEIYRENDFDVTPIALGSSLLLVARTVAAFGRACETVELSGLSVCIAFHDQDPVMRICEAA